MKVIKGYGAPTVETIGEVNDFYVDLDTGDVYRCTCIKTIGEEWGGVTLYARTLDNTLYTWEAAGINTDGLVTDEDIIKALGYTPADDADVTQLKSDLTEEVTAREKAVATEKAERKAEIAVERERINRFTRLEEGSTTGDAELIDARVDIDGITHDCVGDAVRYQTDKLKNNIGTFEKYNFSAIEKSLLHTKGAVLKDGTIVDYGHTYEYEVYNVSDGDVFILNYAAYVGADMCGVLIKDSSDSVIYYIDDVSLFDNYKLVIPSNGSRLYVCYLYNSDCSVKKCISTIQQKLTRLSEYIDVKNADVEGLVKSGDLSIYVGTGGHRWHKTISVTSGEIYRVSCYSANSDYCGAFVYGNNSIIGKLLKDTDTIYTDEIIVIPDGADTLYVNADITKVSLSVEKLATITDEEFWNSYKAIERAVSNNHTNMYVNVSENKIVVNTKWNGEKDFYLSFNPVGLNSIWQFGVFGTINNNAKNVSTKLTPDTIIQTNGTDWFSPHVLKSVNNADGDYTGTSIAFTGGIHGYGGATSNATATGRTANVKCKVDGRTISSGESTFGNIVEIEWDNFLQGANTEKNDGTGREIIKEHIHLTYDGVRWNCENTITALEDVLYSRLYGLQSYNFGGFSGDVYYVGSRANKGANTVGSSSNSGDKRCRKVRVQGNSAWLEFGINDDGLGDFADSDTVYSCFETTNKKAYFSLIFNNDYSFRLNQGEQIYYSGYYTFYEPKTN